MADISGVLATRNRIPGPYIERLWIKHDAPILLRDGQRIMKQKVGHLMTRTGWIGVQNPGHSDSLWLPSDD